MWSYVVEKTGKPGENHRPWTTDRYPDKCLYPESNKGRSGDKRVFTTTLSRPQIAIVVEIFNSG